MLLQQIDFSEDCALWHEPTYSVNGECVIPVIAINHKSIYDSRNLVK